MNLRLATLGLLIAVNPWGAGGETAPAAKKSVPSLRKLFVEPSSSSLAGGTARLVLPALTRQPGTYVGDYQLKVTPYFFKSEKGKIVMIVSDQSLLKITQSVPVEFTGKAITAGTNKTRPITVKATPSASDRGALVITVKTENGPLVFATSYRFSDN